MVLSTSLLDRIYKIYNNHNKYIHHPLASLFRDTECTERFEEGSLKTLCRGLRNKK